MTYDAIVIGGSFAGLSAALQLGRARRSVLVIDAGKPRNRFAGHSHGFLGQDGRTPAAILETARDQLATYKTVEVIRAEALAAMTATAGFEVSTVEHDVFHASKLILTTGITDTLPSIPGLAEEWGRSVFICPYCDGYEVGGGPIGVLGVNANSIHQATLLGEWGDVTCFLNEAIDLSDEERKRLTDRGVILESAAVERWARSADGRTGFFMKDGRHIPMKALFTATEQTQSSSIAAQLGCAFEAGPAGPYLKVDERQRTSVANVFAGGDASRPMHSVAFAVASGAMAGIAAHQSLVFA